MIGRDGVFSSVAGRTAEICQSDQSSGKGGGNHLAIGHREAPVALATTGMGRDGYERKSSKALLNDATSGIAFSQEYPGIFLGVEKAHPAVC
jgi:hypothetical protein